MFNGTWSQFSLKNGQGFQGFTLFTFKNAPISQ